jgi:E3 ubiquitin-protein ligase UBR1/E3 ubiquitin-protein ligase UBR3
LSEYGVAWQECHQLLWNVLNHVKILVKTNETSTAGEALGVTALQMMEIALYVLLS